MCFYSNMTSYLSHNVTCVKIPGPYTDTSNCPSLHSEVQYSVYLFRCKGTTYNSRLQNKVLHNEQDCNLLHKGWLGMSWSLLCTILNTETVFADNGQKIGEQQQTKTMFLAWS